jgi:hypothetical protein
MVRLPNRPWPLWLLGLTLSISSSPRSMDVAALEYYTGGPSAGDRGVMVGALCASLVCVPFTLAFCGMALKPYPKNPPSIFSFYPVPLLPQVVFSIVFFGLTALSLLLTIDLIKLANLLPQHGYPEYIMDTWFNVIASLGWPVLWLSLRACVCARLAQSGL